MILVRLRTGMAGKKVAQNFSFSETHLSRVFATWINFLEAELKNLNSFPSMEEIRRNFPQLFKNFSNTRVVLDAP